MKSFDALYTSNSEIGCAGPDCINEELEKLANMPGVRPKAAAVAECSLFWTGFTLACLTCEGCGSHAMVAHKDWIPKRVYPATPAPEVGGEVS